MNFCITTDSGADLPLSYCQTHDITVLPLAFTIEGQTYHGSGAMDDKVFYDKLRAGALPTTSAANPEDTAALFRTFAGQGKDLLHVAFSSGLSQHQRRRTNCRANGDGGISPAEDYRGGFPVRLHGAGLPGASGRKAPGRRRDAGGYRPEVTDPPLNGDPITSPWTISVIFIAVDRVSKAAAVVGSLMGIKPILHVDDEGHLTSVGKVRGQEGFPFRRWLTGWRSR